MNYSYYNSFLPDDIIELCDYIGDENIFKLVFDKVDLSGRYTSPLRNDSRAGCFFWETPDSRILFVDYGNPTKTHFLSIELVKEYYNLPTLRDAILFVKEKFKSFVGENIPDRKDLVIRERVRKIIKLFPRDWNTQDKLFWSKYGISRIQLEEDKVIPVKYFQVFTGDIFNTYQSNTPSYAYNFIDNTIKIYSPFETNFKWYTNASASTIGNIENIDATGDVLIITKSYKDCRVLRNLGYKNVVWLQNEGQVPRIDILISLINRFEKVYILFDNDEPGKISSNKIKDFINKLISQDKIESIFIPNEYITKDPSDFYEKYGESQLQTIINKIIQDVTKKS